MPTTFFLFIFTLTPFFSELWKVCFAALFGFFQSKKLLSMNIHCSNIFIEVFLQRKREREKKNICLFSKYWTDLLSYYDAVKIRLKKQDINCFFPFFIYMSLYLWTSISVYLYACLIPSLESWSAHQTYQSTKRKLENEKKKEFDISFSSVNVCYDFPFHKCTKNNTIKAVKNDTFTIRNIFLNFKIFSFVERKHFAHHFSHDPLTHLHTLIFTPYSWNTEFKFGLT